MQLEGIAAEQKQTQLSKIANGNTLTQVRVQQGIMQKPRSLGPFTPVFVA